MKGLGIKVKDILAKLDGSFEVGIAAGIDAKLNEVIRLPICKNWLDKEIDEAINFAVKHIVEPESLDGSARLFFYSGIAAIHAFGLIESELNGCDTKLVAANTQFSDKDDLSTEVSEDSIQKALTVICAAKINFYQTNHHVGQGTLSSYMTKVYAALYKDEGMDKQDFTEVAYRLGHYASSAIVLRLLGFKNLKDAEGHKKAITFGTSSDISLRISSAPAGAAKLYICKAGILKMMNTPLIGYFNDVEMFAKVIHEYNVVSTDPVSHHIGAMFLTGKIRKQYDETHVNQCLAYVATFINLCQPRTTLSNSPLLRAGAENMDGYDETFAAACIAYKKAFTTGATMDDRSFFPDISPNLVDHAYNVRKRIEEELSKNIRN